MSDAYLAAQKCFSSLPIFYWEISYFSPALLCEDTTLIKQTEALAILLSKLCKKLSTIAQIWLKKSTPPFQAIHLSVKGKIKLLGCISMLTLNKQANSHLI